MFSTSNEEPSFRDSNRTLVAVSVELMTFSDGADELAPLTAFSSAFRAAYRVKYVEGKITGT